MSNHIESNQLKTQMTALDAKIAKYIQVFSYETQESIKCGVKL